MPSPSDLTAQFQQWYTNEMTCGYALYQNSALSPMFLRTLPPFQHSLRASRPFHIDHLTRSFLTESPDLAMVAFTLHYHHFSYLLRQFPYHLLYARVFHLIQRIPDCSPIEVFQSLTGLNLDSLYAALTAFLEDLAPLFSAYNARFFAQYAHGPTSSEGLSRAAFLRMFYRYHLSTTATGEELYHAMLGPIFHFLDTKHWIPEIPITINTPSFRPFQRDILSMTIPLSDRIVIMISPQTVSTHVEALEKIACLTHELGHALQSACFIASHRPAFLINATHPEIPAILFEDFYTMPALARQNGFSETVVHEIAFFHHYRILLRCIKNTGRTLMLLKCFRLHPFTLSAFSGIAQDYYRTLTRILGYRTSIPPTLNAYSPFYDLDSILGHWVTGVQTIEEIPNLGTLIPITLAYHSYLQKKWAFLDHSFS